MNKSNESIVVVFRFFWMFIPILSVFIPFAESLDISMTEFFVTQSVFGIVVCILEVPSGYLADLFGRKKVIVLGSFVSGCAFVYLNFVEGFRGLLVFDALLGVSMAMVSGADYSLMFDSIKSKMKSPDRKVQGQWVSRYQRSTLLGESLSAFSAALVGLVGLNMIFSFSAIVGWFPFMICLFLKEVTIERMDSSKHSDNFKKVLRVLFSDSKFLRLLFFNWLVWSLSTMCIVWLIQKYLHDFEVSLWAMSLLWGGYTLVSFFANSKAFYLEEKFGSKKCLLWCSLITGLAYLVLPLVPVIVACLVFCIFYVARGIFQPIFNEGLNHRIEDEYRATANSIMSLAFRLAFVVIGPLMGLGVDHISLNFVFIVLGIVFLVFGMVLLRPFLNMEAK